MARTRGNTGTPKRGSVMTNGSRSQSVSPVKKGKKSSGKNAVPTTQRNNQHLYFPKTMFREHEQGVVSVERQKFQVILDYDDEEEADRMISDISWSDDAYMDVEGTDYSQTLVFVVTVAVGLVAVGVSTLRTRETDLGLPIDVQMLLSPVALSGLLSVLAFLFSYQMIGITGPHLIAAGLSGKDMSKKKSKRDKEGEDSRVIPEAAGLVAGAVYLGIMFLFIPIPYAHSIMDHTLGSQPTDANVPSIISAEGSEMRTFAAFIAGILSICTTLFLGFVDDVFDLKWRHKLQIPTLASLPLLMTYFANGGLTDIAVPRFLQPLFGGVTFFDIGPLYYLYMGMLAVFCTNAINILAGINGLEVGQSLVIGVSILVNDAVILIFGSPEAHDLHQLSVYFLLPFVGVSAALWLYNKYPAQVFVGDTYCYFAGMTFAVVGILGHFSKTVLLFFIPQIMNFLYSTPQLFRFIPCPRHRLPRFVPKRNHLDVSWAFFRESELKAPGRVVLSVLRRLRLVKFYRSKQDSDYVACSNLTLLNLALHICGPLHEAKLMNYMLALQVLSSMIAFGIRYGVAGIFFEVVAD
eukprot:Clim_evm8s30 gene=Clim_evmTU8s30